MSVRHILALMVAWAVVFAPFAMPAGAVAMAPVNQHAQSMADDHCAQQPPRAENGGATGDSCCVAMCVAIAVVPGSSATTHVFARIVARASAILFIPGDFAELATPPPRRA